MNIVDVKALNDKQVFWYWITERQQIYERRLAGDPKPWTKDEILQSYRFCNVFRELDTTTAWIRQHWREPYKDYPNLWFAMAVARLFNYIPTLEAIGFPDPWEPKHVIEVLRERKKQGLKVFTSAYMLTGTLGGDKIEQVTMKCLDKLYRHGCPPCLAQMNLPKFRQRTTLEDAFNWFNGMPGIGRFLAYEIVTDLRHTHYLNKSPDIMTWANAGPGAKRGLLRYFEGRPDPKPQLPERVALEQMRHLLEQSKTELPPQIAKKFEMRDIEHSLCEYDKYMRALKSEGRPKQHYNGRQ